MEFLPTENEIATCSGKIWNPTGKNGNFDFSWEGKDGNLNFNFYRLELKSYRLLTYPDIGMENLSFLFYWIVYSLGLLYNNIIFEVCGISAMIVSLVPLNSGDACSVHASLLVCYCNDRIILSLGLWNQLKSKCCMCLCPALHVKRFWAPSWVCAFLIFEQFFDAL